MMKLYKNATKGFTLVELLIVVAIIGVLSTVGIPTFRKMVQKAKKSEAKVALGGLYTAETAFYSEYGAYGSFLDKIGYELSGTGGGTYTIGFPDGSCVTKGIMPTAAAAPNLNTSYPSYFTATYTGIVPSTSRTPTKCEAATTIDAGTDFVATATGAVSPNASLGTLTDMDIWSINKSRTLTNSQDGVK